MLIEMLPSEGKTVVISIVAILLVKFKKIKVDILTSTEYLARRDVEILQTFYKRFGISCDHVCHLDRSNSVEYI
jgi:preprotein translocase subunit SecA